MLEANAAAWSGKSDDVVSILSSPLPIGASPELVVERLSLIGLAHVYLHQFEIAEVELKQAGDLCNKQDLRTCGGWLGARGHLAVERGQVDSGFIYFERALQSARKFGLKMEEATALMNLGFVRLQQERLDEAILFLNSAEVIAKELQAGDLLATITGNLGWANFRLGDSEKSLAMFKQAEGQSVALGDLAGAVGWLFATGTVYENSNDLEAANACYSRALLLARQVNSKGDVINSLESLLHLSLRQKDFATAQEYLRQLGPLLEVSGNRLDKLDVLLARGELTAAQGDYSKAEDIFQNVDHDPSSQTSMRLGAEHQLAALYEKRGQADQATAMYEVALTTFESSREELKLEDSKLPYLANATSLYDDYVHFLISQNKSQEALMVADQSRARTLAQGLGADVSKRSLTSLGHAARLDAQEIAKKADATLLFYWLGGKQSYLWTVTANKTALETLPGEREIAAIVERYRKSIIGPEDPLQTASESSRALYSTLVAPAAELIDPAKPVMILADGELSQLNFETLLVPGLDQNAAPHYWIEDVTLLAAPSLAMLAAAKGPAESDGKLLMLGNPALADENYAELPQAGREMQQIQKHFGPERSVVYARGQANPESYFGSRPERFAYIHFVAHGVASQTDPLDSAIILSRQTGGQEAQSAGGQDSFKLYARDIMRHPIDARLVTISACYGTGTRAYAGEGLVGLSWAFLRAGAHNAIGAMWEASDDSTPMVMDALYGGLQRGETPAMALRNAKLGLLHSKGVYRKPFYWAPFQIYTRL